MNEFIPLKENDPSKIYTLLQKISSGNNKNDLYKIKHKKTGEIFVAKIIKNNLDLYHKQIKSLKKFENPYLVQYYNSFELKDKIWIITEYCDCGNVQDVMKITNKCYKEAEIASIIVMVLKGLQYLHLQKKFHGGIKPSNILLNNDGVIKLSDYNISEKLLLNDDENLNNNNQTKNNIEKSPPELKGKNHLDNYSVKCDIWYLGLTCIELAEGTLDFQEDKIISERNKPNGMKNSNLWSLEFIDFIQKCLSENPLNRPSAASLLNHPFIINNNKGKILIKKKINSIKALIDIYKEKIDEQEEKNNLNEIGKESLEITSVNENLNKNQSENINSKKNFVSLNIDNNKIKKKSLLINRNYLIEKYKKIKKFKIGSKSIQIQSSQRKNNFIINSKASSKKKKIRTSIIKKAINSTDIFAINENSLRKKRRSIVNKCLKNNLLLHEFSNKIFNGSKLNNTLENNHPKKNLINLLNKFDKDKKNQNKILNKSQRIKNIENIFNLLNKKSKVNNAIKEINKTKISNNNSTSTKDKEKKINDKSLSSFDSKPFSNGEKNSKNLNNNNEISNVKIRKRNKKSNGGNPSLSDLNENNNSNWKIGSRNKNKMLRNLLLGDKQKEIINEKELMNIDNNRGLNINHNGIKMYNNEYIFKLNNSANINNKYIKKREKYDYKIPDISVNKNLNKTSKIPNIYYFNQSEIKKFQKPPMSHSTYRNKLTKKKLKQVNKITYKINTNFINNNNINENSNINNFSIKENEKSDYIFNINNTDININLNNINNNNYYNIYNSKYNNKSYSYNNNQNLSILSAEELRSLCLNNNLNQRELPELITELAGLENKMNQEIQKIREEYEPIIMQHKEGIKFLKQHPFLNNIKEFKNFEVFRNKMKYNTNDEFDSRSVSSSVHNLNKIKISFYRANDIEELNISANKYLFDKTGYYNPMMKI